MGKIIVKLKDIYFEWSTSSDSPCTWGMSRDEFERYYRVEYGNREISDRFGFGTEFERRMERVEKIGTSATRSVEGLTSNNRAGPDETELSLDEIYDHCMSEEVRPPAEYFNLLKSASDAMIAAEDWWD